MSVANKNAVTTTVSLSSESQSRRVAAFDFDGTLCIQHSMVPFLLRTHGWYRVAWTMLKSCIYARSRDELKVVAVGTLFKGMTIIDFNHLGEKYSSTLMTLLRPDLLERLRWHQTQGHKTVIVSASLEVYLRPLAKELSVDGVLGVELDVDLDGVLNGKVVGGVNNRCQEKVRRLEAWMMEEFGDSADVELWAYGDDSGDHELLLAASHATWIK